MADSIGTLIATLEADISGFQAGMARAQATLANLESAVNGKTTPALDKMQRGSLSAARATRTLTTSMTMLATSAAAVPGPIGRITTAMLGLELSLPVLAVIATAVAGVAFLLNRASKAADALGKALEFGRVRRERETSAIAAIATDDDVRRLGTLRTRMVELRDAIAQLRATRMLGDIALTPATEAETTLVRRLEMVEEAAQTLTSTVRQDASQALAEAQVRMSLVGEAADVADDAVRRLALTHAGYPADVAASIVANLRLAESLNIIAGAERNLRAVEAQFGGLGGAQRRLLELERQRPLRGPDPFAIRPEVFTQEELDLRRRMEGTLGDEEFQRHIKQLGVSLGRQLIFGMIEGIESLEDLLKSIVFAMLDFAIGAALGGILGGPGGAVAGGVGAAGGGPSHSVMGTVGGAGLRPSVVLPPMQPVTAFFVARDPAFQALLREGTLVSRAAGFR